MQRVPQQQVEGAEGEGQAVVEEVGAEDRLRWEREQRTPCIGLPRHPESLFKTPH